VLTNNFPLSSRWVVFSNLFSPGWCSASGVSSSCPSTAATTWYSSSRSATATTTTVSSPGGGKLDDVFPPWRKSSIRVCPATLLAAGRGDGTSSTVERVDDASTPVGDMSGVVLAPETTTDVVSPQCANPKWTDDASTLAKGLLGISLVPEITVQSVPDATSSPSIDQEVPFVFHPVPFRFSFDPPSDPASVSVFVKAYPNLLGYHMWSSWDRLTTVSTYGPPGSEEEDSPDSGWDFFGLCDPSAMRDLMTACDYCLSDCSNDGHSLGDEGCGPSRECFHVDLGGHDEGNHLGMPEDDDPHGPAPRVDIRTHNSSKSVRCRPSSTRKQGNLCSSGKTSSRSGQAEHSPEKRVIVPETSSATSLTMPGQGCPRPPAGSARIWLQRQYYSEQLRSHPPPSRAMGFSPFFLVYGAEAILPTDLEYGSPRTKAYDDRSNQASREDSLD
jgi:hypothetical protein